MSDFVVYGAGGLGDWRDELVSIWKPLNVEVVDPFRDSRQASIMEFTADDLAHIDRCDLLFGRCNYHAYTGTAAEFGYAYRAGKPIVYVCELPRVDSMMAAMSAAVFTDFAEAAEFARKRYLR